MSVRCGVNVSVSLRCGVNVSVRGGDIGITNTNTVLLIWCRYFNVNVCFKIDASLSKQ